MILGFFGPFRAHFLQELHLLEMAKNVNPRNLGQWAGMVWKGGYCPLEKTLATQHKEGFYYQLF